DVFKDLLWRITGGVGAGYALRDNARSEWTVSAGVGWQVTQYGDENENKTTRDNTAAILIGTDFEHDISSDIELKASYRAQMSTEELSEYSHRAELSCEIDLTSDFELEVSLIWDRVVSDNLSNGTEADELYTTVGLTYEW
ncbi:MAG: DUF481 domain-containing protein, partial [Planctomycetota bacterium]